METGLTYRYNSTYCNWLVCLGDEAGRMMMTAQARRLGRRLPRFGLRTLFCGMALVSALMTLFAPWYRDRAQGIELKAVQAQVFTEPRGHFLLRQFLGDGVAERTTCVHLDHTRVDDPWIKQLGGMEHVEVLSIKSPHLTDAGLQQLKHWRKLTRLTLIDTKVTDRGIASLRRALPGLRLVESHPSSPNQE